MDAQGWVLVVSAITLAITTIMAAAANIIIQLRTAKEAAAKAEEVKVTLQTATAKHDEKLDSIAAVGKRTELYCNSALGRALRMAYVTALALAEETGNPTHIAAAKAAKAELEDHEAKQMVADIQDKKGA